MRPCSYFDYVSGSKPQGPNPTDVVPAPEPIPEVDLPTGMEVTEERFETMSGLYRRVGEIMAKDRR